MNLLRRFFYGDFYFREKIHIINIFRCLNSFPTNY
jgi:hypothetical protein